MLKDSRQRLVARKGASEQMPNSPSEEDVAQLGARAGFKDEWYCTKASLKKTTKKQKLEAFARDLFRFAAVLHRICSHLVFLL